MVTFSKIENGTNKFKNMGTNTNKTLKKYGHKNKLIYGYKLKLKRKLVQIKKRIAN